MWGAFRLILRAVLHVLDWLVDDGETIEPLSTESPDTLQQLSEADEPVPLTGSKKHDGRPVSAVLVLAGLSRATIPVPYWVIARAVDRDSVGVLMALLELEAAGIVVSRRFAGGGVLYAIAGEERWREEWSS